MGERIRLGYTVNLTNAKGTTMKSQWADYESEIAYFRSELMINRVIKDAPITREIIETMIGGGPFKLPYDVAKRITEHLVLCMTDETDKLELAGKLAVFNGCRVGTKRYDKSVASMVTSLPYSALLRMAQERKLV